ncbi:MAG: hypothetical protein ACLU9R_15660 [Faecalibacterium sp.]
MVQPTTETPEQTSCPPRRRAADEKAGMRRFIQIYFYHTECNKSATNRADFAAGMKKTAFFTNQAAQKAAEDGRKSGKVEPSPCGKTKNMV